MIKRLLYCSIENWVGSSRNLHWEMRIRSARSVAGRTARISTSLNILDGSLGVNCARGQAFCPFIVGARAQSQATDKITVLLWPWAENQ